MSKIMRELMEEARRSRSEINPLVRPSAQAPAPTPEDVEAIENTVGYGSGAWDCIPAEEIVAAAWKRLIAMDPDDPGYANWRDQRGILLKVTLDGVELTNVITADEVEGYVLVYNGMLEFKRGVVRVTKLGEGIRHE